MRKVTGVGGLSDTAGSDQDLSLWGQLKERLSGAHEPTTGITQV